MPPDGSAGRTYRDDLAAAYERIAELEARNRELEQSLAQKNLLVSTDRVKDLDATLARWDRVRASLAMLLGFTGLFALRIADTWSVRLALLSTCTAMVTVGIILAWPKVVRARMDPKPWALDVTPWRKKDRRRNEMATSESAADSVVAPVRVNLTNHEAAETPSGELVESPPDALMDLETVAHRER
jgi:hypothetical protein